MNKLSTSHEQVPTVVIIRLETGETTIPGVVGCRLYGVWWFRTVVIIRLSQPSLAGLGSAWAWADLGNELVEIKIEQGELECDVSNIKQKLEYHTSLKLKLLRYRLKTKSLV